MPLAFHRLRTTAIYDWLYLFISANSPKANKQRKTRDYIWTFVCLQNDTPTLAPASLQLLQQLQATTSAATPVAASAGANALSSVQHQLLLQQHLGLGAATPAHAAAPALPSPPEINPANLQGLATLASLSNTAGEYGWCPFFFSFFYVLFIYQIYVVTLTDTLISNPIIPNYHFMNNFLLHIQGIPGLG